MDAKGSAAIVGVVLASVCLPVIIIPIAGVAAATAVSNKIFKEKIQISRDEFAKAGTKTCVRGHSLSNAKDWLNVGFKCCACGKYGLRTTQVQRCVQCDFDVCSKCTGAQARAQPQTRASEALAQSQKIDYPYEWKWLNEHGDWIPYTPELQNRIGVALQLQEKFTFKAENGQTYAIDPKQLTQTNVKYGTIKQIKQFLKTAQKIQDYEWKWCNEHGEWICYPPEIQKQIEAKLQRQESLTFTARNGQTYSIDLLQFTQTNVVYNTIKRINRFLKAAPCESRFPSNWTNCSNASPHLKVKLKETSSEYNEVAKQFSKTCPSYKIISICRVQNTGLYDEYSLCRKQFQQDLGVNGINEKKLFHGTALDTVDSICNNGFDWRKCGKNATLYGCGSYFARDSKYSTDYSDADRTGVRRMFLASVLTGRCAKGTPDLKTAPNGFHSVVDNQASPSIFVVFLIKQAYPEYVIDFKN